MNQESRDLFISATVQPSESLKVINGDWGRTVSMIRKIRQPGTELIAKEICRRMAKDKLSLPPIDTGRPPVLVADALDYAVEQGWLGSDFTLTAAGTEIGLRARTGNKLRRREPYL